jgi:hypothetical protein
VTGQDLPANEIQVNLSTYFDNFDVTIVYPNFALTRKVSETTSLTGRYLVDVVSAASIRGEAPSSSDAEVTRVVNVITSASVRRRTVVTQSGGIAPAPPRTGPDDVRHEFGFGMTHLIAGGTVSVNGIYGTENDYTSTTLAGTYSRAFAKKNTTIQLGLVRSWDDVFPLTKDVHRDKNVVSYSANLTQILSTRLLSQFLFSYSDNSGHLSDDYQLIPIERGDSTAVVDPIHPTTRSRKALGTRVKIRTDHRSSIQLGYRYYWDSWEVNSHTMSINYLRHLSSMTTFGLGLRTYLQGRAFFFQPEYTQEEEFMTADIKLESSFSNELQLSFSLHGSEDHYMPFLSNENVEYNVRLNIYQRHTDTPYWFNGKKDLLAGYFNIGVRYKF